MNAETAAPYLMLYAAGLSIGGGPAYRAGVENAPVWRYSADERAAILALAPGEFLHVGACVVCAMTPDASGVLRLTDAQRAAVNSWRAPRRNPSA